MLHPISVTGAEGGRHESTGRNVVFSMRDKGFPVRVFAH